MKVWRVIADVLPWCWWRVLNAVVRGDPVLRRVRGKFPRFQVKRTIGERQQIAGRLAHWFGNNF